MKLIAVDSSSEACSVAILQGDEMIESWQLAPRQHTQKLLPMLDQLLAEAALSVGQCDAITFARGPGSFTGLRVCISLVQGLAFGADIPVVPVSSLAALAQTAIDQQLKDSTHKPPNSHPSILVIIWEDLSLYGPNGDPISHCQSKQQLIFQAINAFSATRPLGRILRQVFVQGVQKIRSNPRLGVARNDLDQSSLGTRLPC